MIPFIFFLLVFMTAFSGTRPDAWFAALKKPSWNPPNWLFAPVWTFLYLDMAWVGWATWRAAGPSAPWAMKLWFAQLILNRLWTFFFFERHRPDLAVLDILLLLGTILAFMVAAWDLNRAAALLFVPYALWVGFATVLNFSIWRLNRNTAA